MVPPLHVASVKHSLISWASHEIISYPQLTNNNSPCFVEGYLNFTVCFTKKTGAFTL